MPFSSTAGWAGHVGGPFSSHESVAPLAGVNEPKEQLQDPAVVRSDERDIDASKTAATPESAPRRMGLIMVALSMACFLAILDTSIITTALPTIANHFHATQISYSWIGSSYLLTQSAFTPLWGKLSDIFGRKPTVLLANVIFFVGSLVCALANGIPMLIAGRAIQGVGAGGLLVIVTIILGDLASPRERGKYLGILGMVYALAMSTGPIIGGALVERVDWRWCFYINLPCDGAAFILLVLFLKVHNPRTDFRRGLAAIDWLGTLFVIGATLMLLLGLQYGGEQYAWSSVVVLCLIIFGVVVFGVFLGIEWKVAKYPLLPKRLFTRRDVIALFVLISMHGFAMYATTYFIPFYFQEVLGATAIKSAVWFLPSACMMAIFSIVTGLYLRFTGKYTWLIICGMGICTLGIGLLIDLPSYISWPRIIIYQLLVGLGLGPNFQAPLLALQAKFPPADVGVAVSAASAIRSLSAAFSIILGGVIIENRLAAHRKDFVAAGIPPSTAAQIAGSGASGSHEIIGKLPQMQQRVLLQALRDSLSNMWIFYTSLMVIGFAASFFIGRVSLSSDHVEHKTGLQTEEANRLVHAKKPVSETEMA